MFTSTDADKRELFDSEELDRMTYPVMEDFYTIQGEGMYTGTPAYFIRTAGCDVNCFWCDVPESWEEGEHPEIEVGKMVQRAAASGAPIAVITGGEPLLHDLDALTYRLKQKGLMVHIETSGSSPLSGYLDWITFSPKKFKKPTEEIYRYADELKVIVRKNKDFEWAEENAGKVNDDAHLILQPEWYNREEAVPLIVDYVKEHPKWQISLQSHKYMDVP